MYSHIFLGANDIQQSRVFYDAALGALGIPAGVVDDKGRCFYRSRTGVFAITNPIDGNPACVGNGGTIGFAAESSDAVDAWHAAGLASGGTACEDPPGIRQLGSVQLYLAYLRDPSGNKICASHRVT